MTTLSFFHRIVVPTPFKVGPANVYALTSRQEPKDRERVIPLLAVALWGGFGFDCFSRLGGTGWARNAVLDLLAAGKDVVTANKALLALHGGEVFDTARRHNRKRKQAAAKSRAA